MTAAPTQTLPITLAFDPAALQRAQDAAVAEAACDGQALVIHNDTEAEIVAEYLREKVREKDAVVAMQKSALGPLAQAEKTIREWFRPTLQALALIEAAAKQSLGDWRIRVETQKREALAAAQAAAAAHNLPAVAQALTVVNTPVAKQAGVSVRSFWRHAIEAYDKIPDEWTRRVPDDLKLAEYAKRYSSDQTPTPIPGVRFELVTQTSVRR